MTESIPTFPHPVAQIESLVDPLRHARAEHRRAPEDTSIRRARANELAELEARLDGLLDRWVPDETDREAWRDHIRNGTPAPADDLDPAPPIFRGTNEIGSRAEFRPAEDGDYDLFIDGRLVLRLAGNLRLGTLPGPLPLADMRWEETSDAPADAFAALHAYLDAPAEAPWEWARALYADGLIDADFGLTDRGRRVLRRG